MENVASRWIPPALYAAGIFVLSSIPGQSLPASSVWSHDKLVHGVVFAGLGALVYRACRRLPLAIALGVAWGALDELHQRFTAGRQSDAWDLAADAVGATVGAFAAWGVYHALRRRRTRRHADHP